MGEQFNISDSPVNIARVVDELMQPYAGTIGKHYQKYLNHVCRVIENCRLLDNEPTNLHKYIIAGVFHDIGIWTHHTIDYLSPSNLVAQEYLDSSGQQTISTEINLMIEWHHKTTAYKGNYMHTVNIFRKADWIDVSLGFLTFGVNSRKLLLFRKLYPNKGFHKFLLTKLAVNITRHPFKPLPMFRA